jgi:hypothetical protein
MSYCLQPSPRFLLEAAKRALEIAIEDNEEAALAWLLLEVKL